MCQREYLISKIFKLFLVLLKSLFPSYCCLSQVFHGVRNIVVNLLGRITRLKLHQEPEAVQVATLLTVVGAEARKVFATFTDWASDTDQNKIQPVLQIKVWSVLSATLKGAF